MKIKLSNFIEDNKDNFDKNELTSSHIISERYFDHNSNNFDYLNYIEDRVCVMKKSPDLFIYFISTLSFGINLKLYINECFGTKQLIYKNYPFKNVISIDLIYSNGYYLISYDENYFKNFKLLDEFKSETDNNILITLIFQNTLGENINKNNALESCNSEGESNDDSDIDNSNCDIFIDGKVPICKNCLIKNINKVLSNRLNNLIKDNYDNIEFYSRYIELSNPQKDNKKIILTPLEFKTLYGNNSTISKELIKLMKKKNICVNCKNLLEKDSIIKIQCGCIFCKNCIKKIISKETSNKIILNPYEKKEIKCPNCEKEFDLNPSISICYTEEEIKDYEEQANIRKLNSYNSFCINCGKKCNNKNKILEIPGINNDFHIICYECVDNLIDKNKNGKIKQIPIKCKFCDSIHNVDFSKIKKINSSSCCSIF
jgi:hypothetical protein